MDYRAALIEFYQKHNPDKLREIDLLLAKYRGREEELLHALKVKYGVHKTAVPTQQPITQPQPTPKPKQQETPPPSMESGKKVEQPSDLREDTHQSEESERRKSQDDHQAYSTNRGRNAAERAEYWKKELEKRERERSGASKPGSNKSVSKGQEEDYETEVEETEEDDSSESWFSVKRIVFILLAVVLLGGVVFVLLNDSFRTEMGSLFGLTKTESPKQEKKSGIDPNIIAQNQDSVVAKPSGEFALDGEEEPEGEETSTENQTDSRKQPPVEEKEYAPDKKRVEDNPPREDKVPNGLQKNSWYLSYITVSQEGAAKKAVRELQSQGYDNVGYYYIPDYDSRGKRLYKVYIGPYPTVEAAERALDDNLRKISSGTYPYLLK